MESLFQYLPNALFTFLIIVILTVLKTSYPIKRNSVSAPRLPPGPWKLPIIGNLHHLLSSLPHHRLRDLARKHGDLMHLQLGELSHVVVSSAEVAREMMSTHDVNFAQRSFLVAGAVYDNTGVGFAPYGEYWKQLRRICAQQLLSPAIVRSFKSIREEEASKLMEDLRSASGSAVNLSEKIFTMTYGITAKAAFGEKCKDQEAFISVVKEGMKIAGGFSVSELYPSQTWLHRITGFRTKIEQNFQKTDSIIESVLQGCRANKAEMAANDGKVKSLVDVLLDLQENGDLSIPIETKNIKAVMLDMFIAGSDTSSTALEWTMLEMFKNPRVMKKAQAEVRRVFETEGNVSETRIHELTYLKLIIKESLRLHPPAPLLVPREARESCAINGYEIPAKTKVIVNAWSIGRDPRYWTEPERFYPERFVDSAIDFKGMSFELIPFGAGRRMCPGMWFAVANVELPLAQLLFHFDWKLPNGASHEALDTSECFGLTARPKKDIFAVPTLCF